MEKPAGPSWVIHWDNGEYPFTSLPEEVARKVDCDDATAWTDADLDLVIGWLGRSHLPPLTAAEIVERFLPSAAPSMLEWRLVSHPAFVTLDVRRDRDAPLIFMPQITYVHRILDSYLTWCLSASDTPFERFIECIRLQLAPPGYEPDPGEVIRVLRDVGVLSNPDLWGSHSCSEQFLRICLALSVSGRVIVRWAPYPVLTASAEAFTPHGFAPQGAFPSLDGGPSWEELEPRHQTILKRRLLEGATLRQIGDQLGVSHERARQLEQNALAAARQYLVYSVHCAMQELSSHRLLIPTQFAESLSSHLRVPAEVDAARRVLRDCFELAVHPIYGGELWWIAMHSGEPPSLPDLLRWNLDLEIPRAEFQEQAALAGLEYMTPAEWDLLYRAAAQVHARPTSIKACIVRAIKALGQPATLSEIATTVRRLFPDRADLNGRSLYNALASLPPDIVRPVRRGTFGLAEWADVAGTSGASAVEPDPGAEVCSDAWPLSYLADLQSAVGDRSVEPCPGLSLFHELEPSGCDQTLTAAAAAVVSRLEKLAAPRSLCEARPSDDDYAWLCRWAASLVPGTVRGWFSDRSLQPLPGTSVMLSGIERFGCLLLLLVAEAARRDAREGAAWPAVRDLFAVEARPLLLQHGQPTLEHKEAIEAAARRLRLRHTFGQEGTQNWYLSVYLQFGFTRSGTSRLPFWLAGYPCPDSVSRLLDPSSSLNSPTFVRIWRALQNYRRGRSTEEDLCRECQDSPWVLPSWAADLARAAQERLSLRPPVDGQQPGKHPQPDSFLSTPRLRWEPPADPCFLTEVVLSQAMDLTSSRYAIAIGGRHVSSLLRQADGTYHAAPQELSINCDRQQVIATLTDEDGVIEASQQMDLWEAADEIAIFEIPAGHRCDPWQHHLRPNRSYALLASSDLEIEPKPAQWRQCASGTRTLWLLPAGRDPHLQALLEGEVLWSATTLRTNPTGAPESEPPWTRSIRVVADGIRNGDALTLGHSVSLEVTGLLADVTLTAVRIGGRALDFLQEGQIAITDSIELTPDVATRKLNVALSLCYGEERVRVDRRLDHEIAGVVGLHEGDWQVVPPERPITVEQAASRRYRCYLPRTLLAEDRSLSLIEGACLSRRLPRRDSTLGTLAGYGAPLVIRRPYNWQGDACLVISQSVIDPGIVTSVDQVSPSIIRVHLCRAIGPDSKHQVVCWSPGCPPARIAGAAISPLEENVWQVAQPPDLMAPFAVAVAYAGARLGSWWPHDLLFNLGTRAIPPSAIAEVAALMRWFHLPVLGRDFREFCSSWLACYPAEVLSAWLDDGGLPTGLCHRPMTEEWAAAVRQLASDLCPSVEQSHAMLAALAPAAADDEVAIAASRLQRLDPLLMGRVVAHVVGREAEAGEIRDRRPRIELLRRYLAGLPKDAPEAAIRTCQEQLLDHCAAAMGVDTNFLSRGIVSRALGTLEGESLDSIHAKNLALALSVPPFRDHLGLSVLERLAARE